MFVFAVIEYFVLNLIACIFTFKFIGKKFTIYSVIQFTLTSILCFFLKPVIDVEDLLLFVIFGGIINGIGCGLCLRYGKTPAFVNVDKSIEQRKYFSFYDYEYFLDVQKQQKLLEDTVSMEAGLAESLDWYLKNEEEVNKKPLLEFIDEELA